MHFPNVYICEKNKNDILLKLSKLMILELKFCSNLGYAIVSKPRQAYKM